MEMNDILARLRAGENMDDIANELSEMMNKANEAYKNEVAELATINYNKQKKVEIANSMAELFNEFAKLVMPDDYNNYLVTGENTLEMLETTFGECAKWTKAMDKVKATLDDKEKIFKTTLDTDSEKIRKFLQRIL